MAADSYESAGRRTLRETLPQWRAAVRDSLSADRHRANLDKAMSDAVAACMRVSALMASADDGQTAADVRLRITVPRRAMFKAHPGDDDTDTLTVVYEPNPRPHGSYELERGVSYVTDADGAVLCPPQGTKRGNSDILSARRFGITRKGPRDMGGDATQARFAPPPDVKPAPQWWSAKRPKKAVVVGPPPKAHTVVFHEKKALPVVDIDADVMKRLREMAATALSVYEQ